MRVCFGYANKGVCSAFLQGHPKDKTTNLWGEDKKCIWILGHIFEFFCDDALLLGQ
jgi:hypothetical protein